MSTLKLTFAALAMSASLIAPAAAKATSTAGCLDSSVRDNIVGTITRGGVTVTTKNNQPLCTAVTLNLSSYTMPDTYDGNNFDASAGPQQLFANSTVTLPAGQSNLSVKTSVNTPNTCKNTQIDLYYMPVINTVSYPAGHGGQFIAGTIYPRTTTCVTVTPTPVVTPKVTPSPTPKPTATPVVTPKPTTTPKPTNTPSPEVLGTTTQLPDTGAEGLMGAFGLTAMVGTAGIYIKQRLNRQ